MKPLIFIPGIEATNLIDSNTFDFSTVWNAYDNVLTSVGTKLTGPHIDKKLQLDPLFDESVDTVVERYHIARLPYEKSLVNIMAKINEGKRTPDPLYLFGYDWRLSNKENARRLDSFINYLQQKLKDQQVEGFRFLTHSMGGLIMSCYLKFQKKIDHIDKVILCAPPFLGSPYSLIHMIKGDGGFKSFLNRIFGRDDDIRKVVRTFPSLFELIPAYKNSITYTDDNTPLNLTNIDSWQSNVYDDIKDLFQNRLQKLQIFQTDDLMNFNDLPVELKQRMVIVVGSGDDTLVYVKADKGNGKIKNFVRLDRLTDKEDDHGNAIDRNGDGTVPYISSTIFKDAIRTIEVKKENFFDELSNSIDFHGLFLRDSRVQNIVSRFLGSQFLATNVANGQLTSLRGKAANMWYSIGDTVNNLSPF